MRLLYGETKQDMEKIIRQMSREELDDLLVVTADGSWARSLMHRGIAVALDETVSSDETALQEAVGREGAESFICPYVVLHPEEMAYEDFERIYQRQKGIPWTILTTERCLVREFAMEDLAALEELYAWPGITDYTEPLEPHEQEAAYQRDYIRYAYGIFGYGFWLVFDKKTGELIGRAGIETNEDCGDGEAELGYVIRPDRQHQGIATEVCAAILAYAGKELGLRRIFARTHRDNVPSTVLLRRLGFAEKKQERSAEKRNGAGRGDICPEGEIVWYERIL